MKLQDFFKNSLNQDNNLLFQNEMNKLDNKIEKSFQSRYDNSLKNDKKMLNRIKSNYYNNQIELDDDKKQKQINKLLFLLGKNYKQRIKSQFKPLSKPKKVSLVGKVFINNSNSNNDILNIDEKKSNKNIFVNNNKN